MVSENLANLPNGKYTLVGVDVDTTGRRLIDEIVQLAAYTPKSQYAQYIMPYMNLNPAARQRHQVRVITVGFYRLLKCTQTYKVVKSKSEYAALREFLDWIESVQKADTGSLGVVFIYHEERKFIPYMILEAMKKYDLLDRFLKTAKSFANGYELAAAKCSTTAKKLSLRNLSKELEGNNNNSASVQNNNPLTEEGVSKQSPEEKKERKPRRQRNRMNDSDAFEGSASVRAKLAFEIAHNLARVEATTGDGSESAQMLNVLHKYAHPVSVEINELDLQAKNLERQNSFRPVFLQYFKTTLYHRVKAVKFRIVLAEHGHDLNSLNAIWIAKRQEGLKEVVESIDDIKPEERDELVQLLDSFFDPEKTTIKPEVKRSKRRERRTRNKENRPAKRAESADADSTTKTPNKMKQLNEKQLNEKPLKGVASPLTVNNNNVHSALVSSL